MHLYDFNMLIIRFLYLYFTETILKHFHLFKVLCISKTNKLRYYGKQITLRK